MELLRDSSEAMLEQLEFDSIDYASYENVSMGLGLCCFGLGACCKSTT